MRYAFVAGSALGLAAYIRYSALILLPIWIILAIIKYKNQIKKGLITGSMIFLAFLLFIMPWYTRNIFMGKGLTIPFSGKVIFVINQRYSPQNDNAGEGSTVNPTEQISIDGIQDKPGKDPVTGKNDLAKPFYSWFTAHFTHNVMGSLLILPTSLEISTFKTSLANANQIWKPEWDGKLSTGRLILLILQFSVLTFGGICLFKKNKFVTLMFLLMFVGISIANSLGRTSGGRYIVPVDWMVIPIYLAGIFFLFGELDLANESVEEIRTAKSTGRGHWIKTILLVLLIGASPVIFEGVLASVHPNQNEDPPLEYVLQNAGLSLSKEQIDQVENDLASEKARAIDGIVFFPTQQRIDNLDKIPSALFNVTEEKVVMFFIILGNRYETVFFPFDQEIDLKNLEKVYLVGCKSSGTFIVSDLLIYREGKITAHSSEDALNACNR